MPERRGERLASGISASLVHAWLLLLYPASGDSYRGGRASKPIVPGDGTPSIPINDRKPRA
jgi:hypothetical protein